MITLKVAANFGGEIHKAGASLSVSPLVENRMIENGLAYRQSEVIPIIEQPLQHDEIKEIEEVNDIKEVEVNGIKDFREKVKKTKRGARK